MKIAFTINLPDQDINIDAYEIASIDAISPEVEAIKVDYPEASSVVVVLTF